MKYEKQHWFIIWYEKGSLNSTLHYFITSRKINPPWPELPRRIGNPINKILSNRGTALSSRSKRQKWNWRERKSQWGNQGLNDQDLTNGSRNKLGRIWIRFVWNSLKFVFTELFGQRLWPNLISEFGFVLRKRILNHNKLFNKIRSKFGQILVIFWSVFGEIEKKFKWKLKLVKKYRKLVETFHVC